MIEDTRTSDFSEFIIYGDETGDHAMATTYKDHPVFALAFCIFSKESYATEIVRNLKRLKFLFWGHDATILHSSKLRRRIEDFQFLQNSRRRELFIETLNTAIRHSPFTIISTGIDKRHVEPSCIKSENPYELSWECCMERVYDFLEIHHQLKKITHIILESRGRAVDRSLEVAFERIITKNAVRQSNYPLQILFVDKKANSIGLQIADLVAYPIGRFIVDPQRENLALEVFKDKFYEFPNHSGKGLNILPQLTILTEPEKRKASEHIAYSEA